MPQCRVMAVGMPPQAQRPPAPAVQIRQAEIILRMEAPMSSAACGCGPCVLGAVSSSRRRSDLEAARCARETPPPYHQLITCSSRSRKLLVEILVPPCRAHQDGDQISACDDMGRRRSVEQRCLKRRGTMHSLGQISYDGLSRLSHAVDLIEERSQQNRPLKIVKVHHLRCGRAMLQLARLPLREGCVMINPRRRDSMKCVQVRRSFGGRSNIIWRDRL